MHFRASEPGLGAIKEMKPGPINQRLAVSLPIGAEKHRRGEDSLESLDDSGIVPAICREVEELEHLDGARKVYGATLLFYSQCGDPDGY